jgi:hypothetical protein
MVLGAVTQFGTVLIGACFVLCGALIASALWPFGWKQRNLSRPRRLSWLFLAPLEFSALWLWLVPGIEIGAWLLVFGDTHDEFYHRVGSIAAVVAALTSAAVVVRLASGAASRRFARVHLWATLGLLASYGLTWSYDFVQRVEGTTAQRAATNYLARNSSYYSEGARAVERNCDLGGVSESGRHKCFYIMVADQPKARIVVSKMGWFAWTIGGSRSVEPAQVQLERAKRAINERDWERAAYNLRTVIDDFPDTADQQEARALLESLPNIPSAEIGNAR